MKRFSGLQGSASAWKIASLSGEYSTILVLCKKQREARRLYEDIRFYAETRSVHYFPAWDMLPLEPVSPQLHISAERIRSVDALRSGNATICVAPAQALLHKVSYPRLLDNRVVELSIGSQHPRESFIQSLLQMGFQGKSLVEEVGDIAVRGGVIDVFPSTTQAPVRIEFFDDTIERLRLFDTKSQRSTHGIERVSLLPVCESLHLSTLFFEKDESIKLEERIRQLAEDRGVPPRISSEVINALKAGEHLPGVEWFSSLPTTEQQLGSCLLDFVTQPNSLLIVDDIIGISSQLDVYEDLIQEREERAQEDAVFVPKKEQTYLTANSALDKIKDLSPWQFDALDTIEAIDTESNIVAHHTISNTELSTKLHAKMGSGKAFYALKDAIGSWRAQDFRIIFTIGALPRAERLQKILLELEIDVPILSETQFPSWNKASKDPAIVILLGHLHSGFQSYDEQLCVIAESEIFGERTYRTNQQQPKDLKKLLGTLSQLHEGDHVVHVDYGIGIYGGLEHREVGDKGADLIKIQYADSVLFLPVHNISKIQKFSAAEGQSPSIDKLSSQRWSKTKEKVRKKVLSIAGDLIKLYAARAVAKGWRFEPYGAEDERFADDFPYDETPDQLQAIHETLADMASEKPMDRLICGDVGFGKTEVALRAAYKCTQHGRQVAILAPTTILAEQHRQTFEKRLREYPVRVEALSRFYKPAQNAEVLERLQTAETDIVIGTHKLLQKDVLFKDLGLLIIDEEHRFGVKQKEKVKQLRKQVDVLTLTATPIPRTLHMSLLDIRDISLITTPPTDRRSVRTYTANWDEHLIRDAILRELQRNGQAFYVHNRVQGIETITAELQELVPEARFQFAHGQMKESQLEKIMLAYMNHEIDVLVCTTIIESGIDIPNANTMIINRADMFGLAQLYQLRGRVGRSERQAYCYFLVPHTKKLGAEAGQRLKALQSLDDLGQGFHLALRDLEIRGAGNLLGKEQSGTVATVGFELYTKILRDAVQHLKGEEEVLDVDTELSIDADAYIPESYIPDISERLILYQRLASLRDEEESSLLSEEIEDRFGPFGPELTHLMDLMTFRAILRNYGVVKADVGAIRTVLSFHPQANLDLDRIIELVNSNKKKYRFNKGLSLSITHKSDTPHYKIYKDITTLLRQVRSE